MKPLVGIIMGSVSDWPTMRHASETLDSLGVPHEVRVVSAHRTPDLLYEYAENAAPRGLVRELLDIDVDALDLVESIVCDAGGRPEHNEHRRPERKEDA